MKIEQKIVTTIIADDGKLLRRKSDGWIVGEKCTLGYNYYESGIGLSVPKLETPEDYEEIDKPADWEITPIIDQAKRLRNAKDIISQITREINDYGLTNKEVNDVVEFLPKWEDYIGKSLTKGFKVQYEKKPYKVLKGLSNIVEVHTPDITKSEYGLISEHNGTKEDPIPYERWMLIEKDVYYTQNGKLYVGILDAPNGYDADLATLLTLAKEVKE